jgi:cystathionine beta-lyase/cystathionine gamma-synthase
MADRTRIDTYLARLGVTNPRSVPLGPTPWLTSAFSSEPAADFLANAMGVRTTDFYTRYGNPTVRAFENAIAHLEGTEEAFATSSGMAALSMALTTFTAAGGRVLAQDALYGGTETLLEILESQLGAEIVRFGTGNLDALRHALRLGGCIALFETPANPLLEITDLEASARACREAGVVSIVDSTIATPINQTPASHGIDLVVHSATKAIGGHGDFMGGVIAGSTRMIEQIWERAHILGSFMDPFTAWLGIRSLRTLSLRVDRLNSNALALAAALVGHPRMRTVHYPGLDSHAGHAVAARQMKGYGGVLSIELEGGADAAEAVISRFAGARRSASFGGPATLVVRPAAMWAGLSERGAGRAPPGLLRIGVGLEEADTLLEEVLAALS